MNIQDTPLSGVKILTPNRFGDDRGWFSVSWNRDQMAKIGDFDFEQDNHSVSAKAGTLRGLHFQHPDEQTKLVRCVRGAVFDVAVDIRKGSPSYGQWTGATLTPENGQQLLVPVGFAHGFLTLTDNAEVLYKCTGTYNPDAEGVLRWDSCGIDWPWPVGVKGFDMTLKDADRDAPALSGFDSPFSFEG